ncbi:hypothetical protein LWI29_018155 [Acer saccharum]|uniref:Uncharacterized protein n=1 Tax=Acer saccharum TaxID=4024 RepID=A0AA39SYN0_ACESA|nr:hypothetical protein LWI29_018155 [Acer saccharum]
MLTQSRHEGPCCVGPSLPVWHNLTGPRVLTNGGPSTEAGHADPSTARGAVPCGAELAKTTLKQIEDAFKEFTTKDDIGIVLISQYVANMIRFVVDSYNKPIPAILEIPSNSSNIGDSFQ